MVANGPRVTVILPTRNGAAHLETQLAALARQWWSERWDIVFIDNGSEDATPQILDRWLAEMPVPARIVAASDVFSLAYARNAGATAATGRSIAFIDDDDLICDGWVKSMGECLEHHDLVGSSFDYLMLNDPHAAEPRGTFQVENLGVVLDKPVVSGGGSGCRRQLWEELGGNDLAFEHAGEDIDFSLRATRDARVAPHLCRDAIYHVRLRSSVRDSYRQGYRFAVSGVALYQRHGGWTNSQPENVRTLLRRWAGLVRRLPELSTPDGRLKWAWQLGTRVGRLVGSARERIWYP